MNLLDKYFEVFFLHACSAFLGITNDTSTQVLTIAVLNHGAQQSNCQCLKCCRNIMHAVLQTSAREALGEAICSTLSLYCTQYMNPSETEHMWEAYSNAGTLLETLKDVTQLHDQTDTSSLLQTRHIKSDFERLLSTVKKIPLTSHDGVTSTHFSALRTYLWHIAATLQSQTSAF